MVPGDLDAIDEPRLDSIAVAATIIRVYVTGQDGGRHFPLENPIRHERFGETGEVVAGRIATAHRRTGNAIVSCLGFLPRWIPARRIRRSTGSSNTCIAKRRAGRA